MELGFDIYTSRTLLWFALLATLQLALVPFSLGTIGASADLETCMHFAHQDCRRNNLFLSFASFSLLTKVTVIVCSLQIVF